MKIIFAYLDIVRRMWQPCSFREVFRKLPGCEVVECTDFQSIKKHAKDADVFMSSGISPVVLSPDQVRELMNLFGERALICKTSLDTWSSQPFYPNMRLDVTTSFSKTEWERRKGLNAYWLPFACDLRDYGYERDIDLLLWGKVDKRYPFRLFIANTLKSLVTGAPEVIEEGLTMYTIIIGGREYKYAICGRLPKYYSEEIYKLISRSRICPTGPHSYLVPVPKFVEHGACGAISMTVDFSDREELGYVHKENIWLTDRDSFLSDLQYLLENDSVVDEMSANARQLMLESHTTDIRAAEFYRFLSEKTGKDN